MQSFQIFNKKSSDIINLTCIYMYIPKSDIFFKIKAFLQIPYLELFYSDVVFTKFLSMKNN